MLSGRTVAVFLLMVPLTPSLLAQQSESTASLLLQFDNQHDLAVKERLLRTLTGDDKAAGPALLQLAESTANTDTRWMAMRGMATLHYVACAAFLEASLKDSDSLVRANAARALGDLRISDASDRLLAMFAAEQDPGAIQQASLALRMLNIKAAAPYLREKIPAFTGQTRGWLIQALGTLGSVAADVPLIAGYLDEMMSATAATWAIQELVGVSFGPQTLGLSGYPTPQIVAARAWWKSHKDEWPHCGDCRPN
jgi:HEAT repeat protein